MLLTLAFFLTLPALLPAQSLNQYRWKSRLVLCFAPEPTDPLFEQQVRLLYDEVDAFRERDTRFIFITPDGKHENSGRFLREADARKYYERFDVRQYQFEMVLVGYDGYEKFRAQNQVTPPLILLNLIDGMPLRRAELMQGRSNKSMIGDDDNTSRVNKRRRF